MKFQDAGLAIGLQTQFLFRKGGRQGFKSVYRSHLVLGYGQSTEGSLEVDYLGLTFKTQQFSGKSGFFTMAGRPWSSTASASSGPQVHG